MFKLLIQNIRLFFGWRKIERAMRDIPPFPKAGGKYR